MKITELKNSLEVFNTISQQAEESISKLEDGTLEIESVVQKGKSMKWKKPEGFSKWASICIMGVLEGQERDRLYPNPNPK